ncbi:MAG: esterase-like activity of phytase family protein, partial [Hyphomonadaceae bacterium]
MSLSPENMTGITRTGPADLIYALRLDTQRQAPSMPAEFGGLSSLSVNAIEGDTVVFDALTDQGHLARFSAPNPLTWGATAVAAASQVHLTTLTDAADKPLRGANQIDSEGLAPTDTGFLISFERDHRLLELVKTVEGYQSKKGPSLSGFDGLESNGGMEALTRLPTGQFLAAAEYGPDRLGDSAAKLKAPYWIFDQASKAMTAPLGSFENEGRFGITDI